MLRTFAEISGLNVVIDPTIQGTVDVSLKDVPWDQALDIILRANKLGYSVDGNIGLGLQDPEMIDGDVKFGITLKHDVRELPFFLVSFGERNALGQDKPAPLFVNSIQYQGQELTWVRTGSTSAL